MAPSAGEMFERHPVAISSDADHAKHVLSEVFLPVEFPSARVSEAFEMHLNALTVGSMTCGFMRFAGPVRIQTAEAEHFHLALPPSERGAGNNGE